MGRTDRNRSPLLLRALAYLLLAGLFGGSASAQTAANVKVGGAQLNRAQVQPSGVSDPNNPSQVVVGFSAVSFTPGIADYAPAVAISQDGGKSWTAPSQGSILPTPPGFQWGSRSLATYLAAGPSTAAWGLGSTVYLGMAGFHDNKFPPNNDCSGGGIFVYRSDDAGKTWALTRDGSAIPNTQTVLRSQPYIAADSNPSSPFAGRLYMVWTEDVYAGCPQSSLLARSIKISYSIDRGATWSPALSLVSGCMSAATAAVAANGELYVAWYDCTYDNRQMVIKSVDGGVSFGAAVAIASGLIAPPNPLIGSSLPINAAFPVIAADPTDSSQLYVAWSSSTDTIRTDVFVSRSVNGGAAWDPPVRIADDSGANPRDQFAPSLAVDSGGTVKVVWGDDRADSINPGGKLYDVFTATSTDKGTSFSPNVRLSTSSSDPDIPGPGGVSWAGHFSVTASGVVFWTDTRNSRQEIFAGMLIEPAPPSILVTPNAQGFGTALIGSSLDRNFIIWNVGGGTLAGTAVVSPPYSIVSGPGYSVNAGQSQTVTVRFTPTIAGTFIAAVSFIGQQSTSAAVIGTGQTQLTAPPDTTAPDTAITAGPIGTISVNNAAFSWSGTDDRTQNFNLLYAYRLDPLEAGFSLFGSATSKAYSSLPSGNYTFYVKARDEAGNEDPSPATRTFFVTAPPPPPTPPPPPQAVFFVGFDSVPGSDLRLVLNGLRATPTRLNLLAYSGESFAVAFNPGMELYLARSSWRSIRVTAVYGDGSSDTADASVP